MHLLRRTGCLALLFSCLLGPAQDSDFLLNHDMYHLIDRMDIRGLSDKDFFTDAKPYGRQRLMDWLKAIDSTRLEPAEADWIERLRIQADDSLAAARKAKGLWNTFFTNGRDLLHVEYGNDQFQLFVNPALDLGAGVDVHTFHPSGRENLTLLNNIRGLILRGQAFGKIGFHTEVEDNIIRLPQYEFERYEASGQLPGQTLVKKFKDANGVDFFSSRAYMTVSPIRQIRLKFGKDRAFWGDGYQSLWLSDHAPDYLFLTVHSQFWKLSYLNHFTQLRDFIPGKNDTEGTYPRKYAVFHQLTFRPWPALSIGVFESIVYNPYQANGYRGFEWDYLNPVIFYRSIEQSLGSPDNAFIGFSLKYHFLRRFRLYGQWLFDDFNIGRRNDGSGYWGNKYAYQVGMHYLDVLGVPTLDLQVEYNRIRPYMYQHFSIATNYAQYDQSLGHPLGGNLYDWMLHLNYHPIGPLNVSLRYRASLQGGDLDGANYGADINRSYQVSRKGDFDNTVGQGEEMNIRSLFGKISYQIGQTDMYGELAGGYRQEGARKSVTLMGGLRYSLPNRKGKF